MDDGRSHKWSKNKLLLSISLIPVRCIVPILLQRNTNNGNMNEGKGLCYFFLNTDVIQRDKLDMVFAVFN